MSVRTTKSAKTHKNAAKSSTDRWENEGGPAYLEAPEAELGRLGITAVQLTVFDCAGYRYTNLRDAVAASKRAMHAPVT